MGAGRTSFEDFVTRQYPGVVRSMTLYCGDPAVAEELAQDAFARAHQRWPEVEGMRRPDLWVQKVAFNLARSWFRRKAAERRAYTRHGPLQDRVEVSDGSAGAAVRQAVAALPGRQREVIIHRFFLDRSVAETASLLAISPNAVKAATFKGVAGLRAVLGDGVELEEVDRV